MVSFPNNKKKTTKIFTLPIDKKEVVCTSLTLGMFLLLFKIKQLVVDVTEKLIWCWDSLTDRQMRLAPHLTPYSEVKSRWTESLNGKGHCRTTTQENTFIIQEQERCLQLDAQRANNKGKV